MKMLSKKSFARTGLKIKTFASVNEALAFSDFISNVPRVVYLAKIPGKLVRALKTTLRKICLLKSANFLENRFGHFNRNADGLFELSI